MPLNDAMALLRYFIEFTYNVVLKQLLLGLHPFQNLLLIVYDHINYDLRDYFGQNNRRQFSVDLRL